MNAGDFGFWQSLEVLTSHLLSKLRKLRHWIKAGTPLAKTDGNGLTFTLSTAGVAGWILRYRHGGRKAKATAAKDWTVRELVRDYRAKKLVSLPRSHMRFMVRIDPLFYEDGLF